MQNKAYGKFKESNFRLSVQRTAGSRCTAHDCSNVP